MNKIVKSEREKKHHKAGKSQKILWVALKANP